MYRSSIHSTVLEDPDIVAEIFEAHENLNHEPDFSATKATSFNPESLSVRTGASKPKPGQLSKSEGISSLTSPQGHVSRADKYHEDDEYEPYFRKRVDIAREAAVLGNQAPDKESRNMGNPKVILSKGGGDILDDRKYSWRRRKFTLIRRRLPQTARREEIFRAWQGG
jgi:hypothetical protein